MEARNLKKITLSGLVMLMYDASVDPFIRENADIELRNRLKNFAISYEEFVDTELQVAIQRGLDIKNYLIGPNPNMQMLMELYFGQNLCDDRPLLFSEVHLCNDFCDKNGFFTKICDLEVKNIERRMDEGERGVLLEKAYNALLERQLNTSAGYRILPSEMVSDSRFLQLGNNSLNDGANYHGITHSLIGFVNDKLLSGNLVQEGYAKYFVYRDSALLKKQKRILLSEAGNGYEVDYNTEEMDYALKLKR